MGNYKKTVRCGHCNRLGHNKITCPALREDIEVLKELFGAEHPEVKAYYTKRKQYSKKSSNNANKKRYCSYCFEAGHNRRTCSHLKSHKEEIMAKNFDWRKSILGMLKEAGVGVGSLITHDNEYIGELPWTLKRGTTGKDIWMITNINWNTINFFQPCEDTFTISLVKRPSTKRTVGLESLIVKYSKRYESSEGGWEVLSRSYSLNPPKNWLTVGNNIVTIMDTLFNDLTKEAYEQIFIQSDEENLLLNLVSD